MRKIVLTLLALVLLLAIILGFTSGRIPGFVHEHAMPPNVVSYGKESAAGNVDGGTMSFGIKKMTLIVKDDSGQTIQTHTCYVTPQEPLTVVYEDVAYSSMETPVGFYSGIRILRINGCYTSVIDARNAGKTNKAAPAAVISGGQANPLHVHSVEWCLPVTASGQFTVYATQQGLVASGVFSSCK